MKAHTRRRLQVASAALLALVVAVWPISYVLGMGVAVPGMMLRVGGGAVSFQLGGSRWGFGMQRDPGSIEIPPAWHDNQFLGFGAFGVDQITMIVPMWFLAMVAGCVVARAFRFGVARPPRYSGGMRCQHCGYDLRMIPSTRCPECGRPCFPSMASTVLPPRPRRAPAEGRRRV